MRFNLMPRERRSYAKHIISRGFILSLFGVLTVTAAGAWIVGTVFAVQARQNESYYVAYLQLVQIRIIRYNAICEQITRQVEDINKANKKAVHWVPILVCLADTAPGDITVQSLHAEQKRLRIHAVTSKAEDVRNWQGKLRKAGMFSLVSIGKMNTKQPGQIAFELELEIGDAKSKDVDV